jgi:hypothetical protein
LSASALSTFEETVGARHSVLNVRPIDARAMTSKRIVYTRNDGGSSSPAPEEGVLVK